MYNLETTKPMKKKLYSSVDDQGIVKAMADDAHLFSGAQRSLFSQQADEKKTESREQLLQMWHARSYKEMTSYSWLLNYLYENKLFNVLSLGADYCVLEHYLKQALPEHSVVAASDFNQFSIQRAKTFFPNIIAFEFDFYQDDSATIRRYTQAEFDVAVFMGSAYVMDDAIFVKQMLDLKSLGIKQIIDFHAGFLSLKDVTRHWLGQLLCVPRKSTLLRRLSGKPSHDEVWRGKFHGYGRDRSELRRLYKKAGLKVNKELCIPGDEVYKYVAILT